MIEAILDIKLKLGIAYAYIIYLEEDEIKTWLIEEYSNKDRDVSSDCMILFTKEYTQLSYNVLLSNQIFNFKTL
jgi:hypothetical protein